MGEQAARRMLKKIKATADTNPQQLGFMLEQYKGVLDNKAQRNIINKIGRLVTTQQTLANSQRVMATIRQLQASKLITKYGTEAQVLWQNLMRQVDPNDLPAVEASYQSFVQDLGIGEAALKKIEASVKGRDVLQAFTFGESAFNTGRGYDQALAEYQQTMNIALAKVASHPEIQEFAALSPAARKEIWEGGAAKSFADAYSNLASDGSGFGDFGLTFRQEMAPLEAKGMPTPNPYHLLASIMTDTSPHKLPANLYETLKKMIDDGHIDGADPSLNPEADNFLSTQKAFVEKYAEIDSLDKRVSKVATEYIPNLAKAMDKTRDYMRRVFDDLSSVDGEAATLKAMDEQQRAQARRDKTASLLEASKQRLAELTDEIATNTAIVEKYNDAFASATPGVDPITGAKQTVLQITKERKRAKANLDKLNNEFIGLANKIAKGVERLGNPDDADTAAIANSFRDAKTPKELHDTVLSAETRLSEARQRYKDTVKSLREKDADSARKEMAREDKTDEMVARHQAELAERDTQIAKAEDAVFAAEKYKAEKAPAIRLKREELKDGIMQMKAIVEELKQTEPPVVKGKDKASKIEADLKEVKPSPLKEARDTLKKLQGQLKQRNAQLKRLDDTIKARKDTVLDKQQAKQDLIVEQKKQLEARAERLATAKTFEAPEIDDSFEGLLDQASTLHESHGKSFSANFLARQELAKTAALLADYLPTTEAKPRQGVAELLAEKGLPLNESAAEIAFVAEDGTALPARVLIDTGAPASYGSDTLLGNRKKSKRLTKSTGVGAQLSNMNVTADGKQLKGVALGLLRKAPDNVARLLRAGKQQALIGRDILTNYDIIYSEGGSHLVNKGVIKADGDTFRIRSNDYNIKIDGDNYLVDTGADFTILPQAKVDALGGEAVGTTEMTSYSGVAERTVYNIPEFQIGNQTYKDVKVVIADGSSPEFKQNVIGRNILEQGNVLLTKTKVVFGAQVIEPPKLQAGATSVDEMVEAASRLTQKPEGVSDTVWASFEKARTSYMESQRDLDLNTAELKKLTQQLDSMIDGEDKSALTQARNGIIRNTLSLLDRLTTKEERMASLIDLSFSAKQIQAKMVQEAQTFISRQNTEPAAMQYVQALMAKTRGELEQASLLKSKKHLEERLPVYEKRLKIKELDSAVAPLLSDETKIKLQERLAKVAKKSAEQQKRMDGYQQELTNSRQVRNTLVEEANSLSQVLEDTNFNDSSIAAKSLADRLMRTARSAEEAEANGSATGVTVEPNLLRMGGIPVKGEAGLHAWVNTFGQDADPLVNVANFMTGKLAKRIADVEHFGAFADSGYRQLIDDITHATGDVKFKTGFNNRGLAVAISFLFGADDARLYFDTHLNSSQAYSPSDAKIGRTARTISRQMSLSLSSIAQVLDRVPQMAIMLGRGDVAGATGAVGLAVRDLAVSVSRGLGSAVTGGKISYLSPSEIAQMTKLGATGEYVTQLLGQINMLGMDDNAASGLAPRMFSATQRMIGTAGMNALGNKQAFETASRILAGYVREASRNPDRMASPELARLFQPFGILPDDVPILMKGIDEDGLFIPELIPDAAVAKKARSMTTALGNLLGNKTLGGSHASLAGLGTHTGTWPGEIARSITMITTFPRVFAGQVMPALIRDMGGRGNVAGSAAMLGAVAVSSYIFGMMRDSLYESLVYGEIKTNKNNHEALLSGNLEDFDAGQEAIATLKYFAAGGMFSSVPGDTITSMMYGFAPDMPTGVLVDQLGTLMKTGSPKGQASAIVRMTPALAGIATTAVTKNATLGAGIAVGGTLAGRSLPLGRQLGDMTGNEDFEYGVTKALAVWLAELQGKEYDPSRRTRLDEIFGGEADSTVAF
jgi:hypothetical protein